MNEEKINQELETYKQLAQEDKQVDVASLMIGALQQQQANLLPDKQKRVGYLISLAVPPFGLLYAARFYFSGKSDGKTAAWMCVVLTFVSIGLFWLLGAVLFSSSGASLKQLNPGSIQQLQQTVQ